MTLKPGTVWAGAFVTLDATGAKANSSVGPSGTLYVNGVPNSAVVTIVTGTNPYKWSVTVPQLNSGDFVQLYAIATISGITSPAFVAEDQVDTYYVSDVNVTGTVTLNSVQGAITWGQQKIVANVANEGALDIRNANGSGIGTYNVGGNIGQLDEGDVGHWNDGSLIGQKNVGGDYGEYNYSSNQVGQRNEGNTYGWEAIGNTNPTNPDFALSSDMMFVTGTVIASTVLGDVLGTVQAIVNGYVTVTGSVIAISVLNPVTVAGYVQVTGTVVASSVIGNVGGTVQAVVDGYVTVTGTVQATVTSPVTVTGYVLVTGTPDVNVEKWNTIDVVSNAVPPFAAGTVGGLPTVDGSNYIAGIQGTKNQFDDLNDIPVGSQMDLVNAPNATAITTITDDVFAELVEGSVTFKQWVRRTAAVLFGKASGGGVAGSKKFRNLGDTVDRVDATTDANGNRTSVNFDDT